MDNPYAKIAFPCSYMNEKMIFDVRSCVSSFLLPFGLREHFDQYVHLSDTAKDLQI